MSEYGTRNHNVSGGRSTTLPGLGRVPRDASPELKRYLEALQEIIEVRNGFRGDVRDRAITLRELIESGLAKDLESLANDLCEESVAFESGFFADVCNSAIKLINFYEIAESYLEEL